MGYLDITVDLIWQERHPHDDGSDLLVMTLEVTNHGSRTLDGYGVSMELVVSDGQDVLYYPRTHWADGPMVESCPADVPSIPTRLTKTWISCFEVPAGLEPDLLVIIGGFGAGHTVQFDARQATSCLDLFHDTVCVPYTLNDALGNASAPEPARESFGVFDALDGAKGIATAEITGRSYAVVASSGDDASR